MSFSSLEEILNAQDFALPFSELDDSKSAKFYYDQKIGKYFHSISNLPETAFGSFDKDDFLERLTDIKRSISDCLDLYLNGFPAAAYSKFKSIISISDVSSHLINFRIVSVKRKHRFFRTKRVYESLNGKSGFTGSLSPSELFHIPFEQRKTVGTNRFSIPGFPSLYLSDSLHTSWSEIASNDTDPFHAICFTNHRPLYFADMVPFNCSLQTISVKNASLLYDYVDNQKYLHDYALVYPIILTCHSKIKYVEKYSGEVRFKSEYIIPQLLLQWYREQGFLIDGIRYLSCTAHTRFAGSPLNYVNYVIPVADAQCEAGFCKRLIINFSSSSVFTASFDSSKPCDKNYLEELGGILQSSAFSTLSV